ncbi:hypothetical protein BDQ12DRAFT_642266 [Crucibulum laeve]|uniref:DUF7330 domain-containing protein n=1 Tax=Crucibulum laeve TaxID=68775 RepID=A0A5C3MIB8_9AGAR|nr:hypothetical protein BDQ12DRAFT_642266 [Crucibulum laeve]
MAQTQGQNPRDVKQSQTNQSVPVQPPLYGSYQSGSSVPRPYPGAAQSSAATQAPAIVHNESPAMRFSKAFIVAVAIWILITGLVQSMVITAHRHHRYGGVSTHYPIPSDVFLDRCITSEEWSRDLSSHIADFPSLDAYLPPSAFPYTSKTTFSLPLSSDVLFLLSRGPLSSGSVDIVTSSEEGEAVKVDVVVKYFREHVRDISNVCLVSRKDGEIGIGIFSPEWANHHRIEDQLYFEVVVSLPRTSNGKPLLINRFETDVLNTPHRIGDLSKSVIFQSIDLKGSNAPIYAKSIRAHNANIHTSNGPIQGIFNTSHSLVLETSNSPIRVQIGMTNDKDGPASEVTLHSTNGAVESDISLMSTSKKGGTFNVKSRTSNGPLRVNFLASPIDSTLHLNGKTSNNVAEISLDTSYEGKFLLKTSNHAATLRKRRDVEDPRGQERKRTVNYKSTRGTIVGDVHWSNDSKAEGTVRVVTSNSPVVLDL